MSSFHNPLITANPLQGLTFEQLSSIIWRSVTEIFSPIFETDLINIFITMNNDLRLLTEKDICRLFQVSESTLKRRVNSGNFPQPIKFGRLNRWRYTDVLQVYNNQFNGGNGNAFA